LALKFLYQIDISKEDSAQALGYFWQEHRAAKPIRDFADAAIRGIVANLPQIDKLLIKYTQNWQLKRMAIIDRNILRLGCYELLFLEDIPARVSLNEAIELAKKYGDTESSKFVNGILDKIHKEQGKK